MTRVVRFAPHSVILIGLMLTLFAAAALVVINASPIDATLPKVNFEPKIGKIVHHAPPYVPASPCGGPGAPPTVPAGGRGGASDECRPSHSR